MVILWIRFLVFNRIVIYMNIYLFVCDVSVNGLAVLCCDLLV